jgi:hypothetical protein
VRKGGEWKDMCVRGRERNSEERGEREEWGAI